MLVPPDILKASELMSPNLPLASPSASAEAIAGNMVAEQMLDVDVVLSSTNSVKVINEAVEGTVMSNVE